MMYLIAKHYIRIIFAIGLLFSSAVADAVNQPPNEIGDIIGSSANAVVMQPGIPLERKEEVVAGNPLWGVPLATLSATRERPIFLPSRRVLASPVAAPASAPMRPAPAIESAPLLSLIGVVAGSEEGVAIFVDEQARENIQLRTGEGINGWILVSVQPREVVLKKDYDTKLYKLPSPTGDRK